MPKQISSLNDLAARFGLNACFLAFGPIFTSIKPILAPRIWPEWQERCRRAKFQIFTVKKLAGVPDKRSPGQILYFRTSFYFKNLASKAALQILGQTYFGRQKF